MDSISKYISLSQLTGEIESGTYPYDHVNWINSRIVIESFMERIAKVYCIMLGMKEDLVQISYSNDLNLINNAIEEHKVMKKKISEIPVEEVDSEAQQLLAKLSYFMHDTNLLHLKQNKFYNRELLNNKFFNPDVESTILKIFQIVNEIHLCRQSLLQLWNLKRIKYEQHLQLLLYESDANKMLDWLANNKDIFMRSFIVIGNSMADVKELQEKHGEFATASVDVYMNITKLQQVANNMVEGGHSSAPLIKQITSSLDRSWKEFATILEQRNFLLTFSAEFYSNVEEYTKQVNTFSSLCDNQSLYSYQLDVTELESLVKKIQSFYEQLFYLYNEIHTCSKKLLAQLEHLYKKYSEAKLSHENFSRQFYREYTESCNSMMGLMQNIAMNQKNVESIWHYKKIKIHQRLALALFQDDVRQVLDWINIHGNGFLNKNPGIGKNHSKAKILQKSHAHFETVAQNTYTNAEKLLAAAEELARTGECNSEEISKVARQLQSNISSFAKRVENRRTILNLAVTFYSLDKEINNLVGELRNQVNTTPYVIPENKDMIEKMINNFMIQRKSVHNSVNSAIAKGQLLVNELKNYSLYHQENFDYSEESYHSLSSSITTIESLIEKLKCLIPEFEDLWNNQQYKHEICLKLRLYEKDSANITSQIEICIEDMQSAIYHDESKQFHLNLAELHSFESALATLNEKCTQLKNAVLEAIHYGQELNQASVLSPLHSIAN